MTYCSVLWIVRGAVTGHVSLCACVGNGWTTSVNWALWRGYVTVTQWNWWRVRGWVVGICGCCGVCVYRVCGGDRRSLWRPRMCLRLLECGEWVCLYVIITCNLRACSSGVDPECQVSNSFWLSVTSYLFLILELYAQRDVRAHIQRLRDLLAANPFGQSLTGNEGLSLSFLSAITLKEPAASKYASVLSYHSGVVDVLPTTCTHTHTHSHTHTHTHSHTHTHTHTLTHTHTHTHTQTGGTLDLTDPAQLEPPPYCLPHDEPHSPPLTPIYPTNLETQFKVMYNVPPQPARGRACSWVWCLLLQSVTVHSLSGARVPESHVVQHVEPSTKPQEDERCVGEGEGGVIDCIWLLYYFSL